MWFFASVGKENVLKLSLFSGRCANLHFFSGVAGSRTGQGSILVGQFFLYETIS
jgi:hypothetical protein